MKKKFLFLLILTVIFAGIYFYMERPQKVIPLHIKGGELLDEHGKLVILKGISLGWHNWYPRFYNAGTIKTLHKDWNCNTIRLAMGIEHENGYLQNPDWSKDLIKSAIKAAIKEGVYVIVDWHSHKVHLTEAKGFFSEIAKEFAAYPNIIYEIFNEPEDVAWPEIMTYSKEIISEIRKYDPDNIIIVGTPQCNQRLDFAVEQPLTGYSNIVYSLHFYAGSHGQWLRNIAIYSFQKGLPLFVTECSGTELTGNGSYNYNEMNQWLGILGIMKLSQIFWSLSDKQETSAMLKPSADSFGNWSKSDLTESGKYTKGLLNQEKTRKKMLLLASYLVVVIFTFLFFKKK